MVKMGTAQTDLIMLKWPVSDERSIFCFSWPAICPFSNPIADLLQAGAYLHRPLVRHRCSERRSTAWRMSYETCSIVGMMVNGKIGKRKV